MLADMAHDVEQMFLQQSDVVADLVRRRSRDVSVLAVCEWFTLDVHTWTPEDSVRMIKESNYEPDGHTLVEAAEATGDWQNTLGVLAQNAYQHTAEVETCDQLERLIDVVDELEFQYPEQMEFIQEKAEEIVASQLHGMEPDLQFSRLGCVRLNG
jgi:hypothetical protein